MIKFDKEKLVCSIQGALSLRPEIERIVDSVCVRGFDSVCYLGIGGTWASALQVEAHVRQQSDLSLFVENAAEYNTRGNKRITDQTVVVISSVSGTTEEMVTALETIREAGATVIGFVDRPHTPLADASQFCISYPENEQLKFFMVADRFMANAKQFSDYEQFYAELDQHLARGLAGVQKDADQFAERFAEMHHDDDLHYFVGAGTQYGSTYSYAMCYWEEQHWIRTKSIRASEFFHGTLEVIDRGANVTVFMGEDAERHLAQRVVDFLPRICARYSVIDSQDYALPGISDRFRGYLSHLVTHMVTERIDAHIEHINCHPMDIRRYYRQLCY